MDSAAIRPEFRWQIRGRTERCREARTVAGTCSHGSIRDRMHLPERINRYPTPDLNRELYFWLAAWFAFDRALDGEDAVPPGLRHLFRGLATTARVLDRFPALSPRYERLCAEELAQRRDALPALGNDARQPAHQLEAAIRFALGAGTPPRDAWLAGCVEEARRGTCPGPAAAVAPACGSVSSRVPLGLRAYRTPRPAPALAEAAGAPPCARNPRVRRRSPIRPGLADGSPDWCSGP